MKESSNPILAHFGGVGEIQARKARPIIAPRHMGTVRQEVYARNLSNSKLLQNLACLCDRQHFGMPQWDVARSHLIYAFGNNFPALTMTLQMVRPAQSNSINRKLNGSLHEGFSCWFVRRK